MGKTNNEYIYLDGMFLREEQLLKLSFNVGDFVHAEHYLCALLAHGAIYGLPEMVNKVNEVREHYGVPRIPTPDNDRSASYPRRQGETVDDKARSAFIIMNEETRKDILRTSLRLLRDQYHLFKYGIHWLGVYLVIRDRLEGERLKMKEFINYAREIMPEEWPSSLVMNQNTYKNFGREIRNDDKGEAYYDMEDNPQSELCNTFWDIVKQTIMTT